MPRVRSKPESEHVPWQVIALTAVREACPAGLCFPVRGAGGGDEMSREDKEVPSSFSEHDTAEPGWDQGDRSSVESGSTGPIARAHLLVDLGATSSSAASSTDATATPPHPAPVAAPAAAPAAEQRGGLLVASGCCTTSDAPLQAPLAADSSPIAGDPDWAIWCQAHLALAATAEFLATEARVTFTQDVPEGAFTVGRFLSSVFGSGLAWSKED